MSADMSDLVGYLLLTIDNDRGSTKLLPEASEVSWPNKGHCNRVHRDNRSIMTLAITLLDCGLVMYLRETGTSAGSGCDRARCKVCRTPKRLHHLPGSDPVIPPSSHRGWPMPATYSFRGLPARRSEIPCRGNIHLPGSGFEPTLSVEFPETEGIRAATRGVDTIQPKGLRLSCPG